MDETRTFTWSDVVEAFAVPGADHLIDTVHPLTGKSMVNGFTLEQLRARDGSAVEVVNINAWCLAKGQRQRSPITWEPTTKARYWEMLEVLPPAAMMFGGFLVGEPMDSEADTGRERFSAFRQIGFTPGYERYYEASRPLTRAEFKAEVSK